jgi:hypothetical protein
MLACLGIWKSIIANPFSGYRQVTKDTRIAWPIIFLLLLVAVSTSLILPITASPVYFSAAARAQRTMLAARGMDLDEAQLEALEEQLASPATRAITNVTTYVGGLLVYLIVLMVVALIVKALTAVVGAPVTYRQVLAIVVFASVVSAVQGLVKAGITLAGGWQSALRSANDAEDLRLALQSSLSLALVVPYASLGKIGFVLLDAATDIFNWIYYVFIYAGLTSSAGLRKPQALMVTLVTGVLFLGVSVLLSLLY